MVIGIGTMVGSALLALWVLVRYREFGPHSLRSSVAVCVVAALVLGSAPTTVPWVVDAVSPPVALLTVAVPMFVLAFWSAGVLMRVFAAGLPRR